MPTEYSGLQFQIAPKFLSPSVSNPRVQTLSFFHAPPDLSYDSPQFLPRERRSRRWHAGRNRRLRSWANVARGPGRFRPRVPLRALRPGCAGRCASGARAKMPSPPEAERTETEIAGGARTSRHILDYRKARPRAPLPELLILSLSKDDNGQTGNGAWQRRSASPSPPVGEGGRPRACRGGGRMRGVGRNESRQEEMQTCERHSKSALHPAPLIRPPEPVEGRGTFSHKGRRDRRQAIKKPPELAPRRLFHMNRVAAYAARSRRTYCRMPPFLK